MNKAITIIIVIVIVIFGGYYLLKGKKSSNPNSVSGRGAASQNLSPQNNMPPTTSTAPTQEGMMVSYTDSGFSPKEITIKVGQTVTWRNDETDGKMWVASAPHPTHTDYPGFDAKKEMGPGETYSFTFDKVGDWKYHNHLDPTENGIVHVTQ